MWSATTASSVVCMPEPDNSTGANGWRAIFPRHPSLPMGRSTSPVNRASRPYSRPALGSKSWQPINSTAASWPHQRSPARRSTYARIATCTVLNGSPTEQHPTHPSPTGAKKSEKAHPGKGGPPLPILQIAEAGLERVENRPGKTAPAELGRAKSDVNRAQQQRLADDLRYHLSADECRHLARLLWAELIEWR